MSRTSVCPGDAVGSNSRKSLTFARQVIFVDPVLLPTLTNFVSKLPKLGATVAPSLHSRVHFFVSDRSQVNDHRSANGHASENSSLAANKVNVHSRRLLALASTSQQPVNTVKKLDFLSIAKRHGIPIVSSKDFVQRLKAVVKERRQSLESLRVRLCDSKETLEPCIKLYDRNFKCIVYHLDDTEKASCPFIHTVSTDSACKDPNILALPEESRDYNEDPGVSTEQKTAAECSGVKHGSTSRATTTERHAQQSAPSGVPKDKSRPSKKLKANDNAKKEKQSGYCEICKEPYKRLDDHRAKASHHIKCDQLSYWTIVDKLFAELPMAPSSTI